MTVPALASGEAHVALLERARCGDRRALAQLVGELRPTIRASVAATLARRATKRRGAPSQEVEDITQSMLLALFADPTRLLTQWDPERGLSLPAFVAFLAKRETLSVLRSRRRNPWTEEPTVSEELDRNLVSGMGPESETITRDLLTQLVSTVRPRLTARGIELFELLFLRGLSLDEVATATGLSADAVYTWNHRLTRLVQETLEHLRRTLPPPRPTPPKVRQRSQTASRSGKR